MLKKRDIKCWLRSGSWRFMQHSRAGYVGPALASYCWRGHAVYYRPGTSDPEIIYNVLLRPGRKAEYSLPDDLQPRTILDIGANIGITSVYFADRFPQAAIYCVEPMPDNYAILSKNIERLPDARGFQVALGKEAGLFPIYPSEQPLNFGGFSFFEEGSDKRQGINVEMRQTSTFLSDIGLHQVDLIKIDTEGSEYDILAALGDDVLSRAQWITGELHGVRDFELLAYLSQWFDIGVRKTIGKRLCMFNARNRILS